MKSHGRLFCVIPILFAAFSCAIPDQIFLSSLKSMPVAATVQLCTTNCDTVLWSGTLQDQTVRHIDFVPPADGEIWVKWSQGQGSAQWRGGYVTPKAGRTHRITILDNDTVSYDASSH